MNQSDYINPVDPDDLDIIKEYTEKNLLGAEFPHYMTYDLVQSGYPYPNKGIMVPKPYSETDKYGMIYPGKGMWIKREEVEEYIQELKSEIALLKKYKWD